MAKHFPRKKAYKDGVKQPQHPSHSALNQKVTESLVGTEEHTCASQEEAKALTVQNI